MASPFDHCTEPVVVHNKAILFCGDIGRRDYSSTDQNEKKLVEPLSGLHQPRSVGIFIDASRIVNPVDNGYIEDSNFMIDRNINHYVAKKIPHLPDTAHQDQIETKLYENEVYRLGRGEAGKRARDLLFSVLNDRQKKMYFTHNFFDYRLVRKGLEDFQGETIWGLKHTVSFRIYTTYPNGNVRLLERRRNMVKEVCTICLHPKEPYPLDDILLQQILNIQTDPAGVIEKGNLTEPYSEEWHKEIQ